MMNGSADIAKDTLNHKPMVSCGCMHKLGDFVHGKGEIWSDDSSVLENTNNITIEVRIIKGWVIIKEERRRSG
jgi:hypothetical protein